MANLESFLKEIKADVYDYINQSGFVEVSETTTVPNINDEGFTFSSGKGKKGKRFKTCVLFIDMRNSTQISNKHRQDVLARLYTAFLESMVRAAEYFGGKVRQIVGDRVMVVFDTQNCVQQAWNTAGLLNTVSKYILDKQFTGSEIKCGIGIDYGEMLVIKTGLAKQGTEKENYRSLVWLGKPANIASKLADIANKADYRPIMFSANVLDILKNLESGKRAQDENWISQYNNVQGFDKPVYGVELIYSEGKSL